MIQILLYVTMLYTTGINEYKIVILLSNSYQFSMKFVLFSVYFSFHSTAQLYNSIALIACRSMAQNFNMVLEPIHERSKFVQYLLYSKSSWVSTHVLQSVHC